MNHRLFHFYKLAYNYGETYKTCSWLLKDRDKDVRLYRNRTSQPTRTWLWFWLIHSLCWQTYNYLPSIGRSLTVRPGAFQANMTPYYPGTSIATPGPKLWHAPGGPPRLHHHSVVFNTCPVEISPLKIFQVKYNIKPDSDTFTLYVCLQFILAAGVHMLGTLSAGSFAVMSALHNTGHN